MVFHTSPATWEPLTRLLGTEPGTLCLHTRTREVKFYGIRPLVHLGSVFTRTGPGSPGYSYHLSPPENLSLEMLGTEVGTLQTYVLAMSCSHSLTTAVLLYDTNVQGNLQNAFRCIHILQYVSDCAFARQDARIMLSACFPIHLCCCVPHPFYQAFMYIIDSPSPSVYPSSF